MILAEGYVQSSTHLAEWYFYFKKHISWLMVLVLFYLGEDAINWAGKIFSLKIANCLGPALPVFPEHKVSALS